MARPKKYINKKQFESLCAIQCTKEEICDVLDVTEKTLNRWCKEEYGENFSLVFRQKKSLGKTSLRRHQWKLAEAGNYTMQIWLGKQMLGQSESPIQDKIKLKELELKEKEFERIPLFTNYFKSNEITEHVFVISNGDREYSEKDCHINVDILEDLTPLIYTLVFQITAARNCIAIGVDTSKRPPRRRAFAHIYKDEEK